MFKSNFRNQGPKLEMGTDLSIWDTFLDVRKTRKILRVKGMVNETERKQAVVDGAYG